MKISIKKSALILLLFLILGLAFLPKSSYVIPVLNSHIPLSEKWHTLLPQNITEVSKSDDESIVIVRTSTKLYALESTTGNELWNVDINLQISQSPALEHNGIIYICDSNALRAFRSKDGKEIWHQTLEVAEGQLVGISGDVVAIDLQSSEIRAYITSTGKFLWAVPTGRGNVAAYLTKNLAIIPDQGIMAVDLYSGKLVWQVGDGTIGQGSYQNGVIYYTSENYVHAFDVNSRNELWKIVLPDNGLRKFYNFDNVLLMGDTNYLYNIVTKDGETKWKVLLNGPSSPVIYGGYIFVFEGFSGKIQIIELVTGHTVGYIIVSGPKFSMVDNQKIISFKNEIVFFEGKTIYAYKIIQ